MKRRYSGFLLMLTLMFAVILGFIPGLETAMTAHAEEESEVSEELYATESVTASGTCGENLTWALENGTLTISGTGWMDFYYIYPWENYDSQINKIIIGKGVTYIESEAFAYFKSLSSITFEGDLPYIGSSAFYKCDALKAVYVNSMETWLEAEFEGHSANPLTNGADLYINGKVISTLAIPDGIKTLNANAFKGGRFTKVIIPDSVEEIGEYCFYDCTNLSSVVFEGTVPSIGKYCFNDCDALKAVYVNSMEAWLEAEFEDSYANPLSNGGELYINGVAQGSTLIIPSGIETLPPYAFSGCCATKVIIPDSVKTIGKYCFHNCTKLVSVDLSSNLESINMWAFGNCKQLESMIFPTSIKSIDQMIFYGCDNLKKVFFEGNAPYINKRSVSQGVGSSSHDYGPDQQGSFYKCTFTAYYPQSNTTWTKEVREANYGGKITWIGYESDLTTPSKPYKIVNVVSGIHVYWNVVDGVTKYGLWRSETGAGGSYKWVGNPTTNHFTDTKVESGKTYYYCVSTCNPKTNAHSIISEPLGITYVSTPDITNRMNMAAGVKLTWNKIDGATGYAIYRKPYTGNAAWVRVTTISGNETFIWTDKSVASANGTLYRYTIRALAGSDMKTLSGCRNTGRTMARLTSRTMNSVTKTGVNSVKCIWATTAQASGYEVRFMNGDTIEKQFTVGNYKTGAKTFNDIPADANYKVQVRSYKKVAGVGVFYSAWSTPKYVNL